MMTIRRGTHHVFTYETGNYAFMNAAFYNLKSGHDGLLGVYFTTNVKLSMIPHTLQARRPTKCSLNQSTLN